MSLHCSPGCGFRLQFGSDPYTVLGSCRSKVLPSDLHLSASHRLTLSGEARSRWSTALNRRDLASPFSIFLKLAPGHFFLGNSLVDPVCTGAKLGSQFPGKVIAAHSKAVISKARDQDFVGWGYDTREESSKGSPRRQQRNQQQLRKQHQEWTPIISDNISGNVLDDKVEGRDSAEGDEKNVAVYQGPYDTEGVSVKIQQNAGPVEKKFKGVYGEWASFKSKDSNHKAAEYDTGTSRRDWESRGQMARGSGRSDEMTVREFGNLKDSMSQESRVYSVGMAETSGRDKFSGVAGGRDSWTKGTDAADGERDFRGQKGVGEWTSSGIQPASQNRGSSSSSRKFGGEPRGSNLNPPKGVPGGSRSFTQGKQSPDRKHGHPVQFRADDGQGDDVRVQSFVSRQILVGQERSLAFGSNPRKDDGWDPRAVTIEEEKVEEDEWLAYEDGHGSEGEAEILVGEKGDKGGDELLSIGNSATSSEAKVGGEEFDLKCDHFERCSGCTLDSNLNQPPVLRDAISFFTEQGIHGFSIATLDIWNWRCRAKLAVRGTASALLVGLYEEGSHEVVDIPFCRAHHPKINAATQLVRKAVTSLSIQPYNEDVRSGHLRYLQLVLTTHNTALPIAERYDAGKVQLSLVWNARDEAAPEASTLMPLVEELWRKGGPGSSNPVFHSIWANFQTSNTNVIFGGRWRHLMGQQEMWERVGGIDMCFTPGSFGQANYKAFEVLLKLLQKYVPRGSSVTELYAGAGVIGLSLANSRACRRVRCVEMNPSSQAAFAASMQRLLPTKSVAASWHCADASDSPMKWLQGSEVVIVDPPRKGLDPSVISALRLASLRSLGKARSPSPGSIQRVEKRPWVLRGEKALVGTNEHLGGSDGDELTGEGIIWPTTLIYVSCGWEAFKKDCAELLKDDAWHVANAHSVQFFPGTDSLETLAVFKRGKKPGNASTKLRSGLRLGKRGSGPKKQVLKGNPRELGFLKREKRRLAREGTSKF